MTKLTDHYDDVGPGWRGLLDRLHTDITVLAPDYEVDQVKEKYGALRIYLTGCSDDVELLLDNAEAESQHICEECGNPGETGGQYWLKTLCPEHRVAADEAKKSRWL